MTTKKDSTKKVPPRQVPHRDDYYMGLAFWVASKSKDPRTQIGAILISSNNEPLSSGYNGPPRNIPDTNINWDRPHKYPFIRHAEVNAISYARGPLLGATLYVTAAPCSACMLDIAAEGIKRVIYFKPRTEPGSMLADDSEWQKTQEIAQLSFVQLDQFTGNLNWMRDRIKWMEELGVFG